MRLADHQNAARRTGGSSIRPPAKHRSEPIARWASHLKDSRNEPAREPHVTRSRPAVRGSALSAALPPRPRPARGPCSAIALRCMALLAGIKTLAEIGAHRAGRHGCSHYAGHMRAAFASVAVYRAAAPALARTDALDSGRSELPEPVRGRGFRAFMKFVAKSLGPMENVPSGRPRIRARATA